MSKTETGQLTFNLAGRAKEITADTTTSPLAKIIALNELVRTTSSGRYELHVYGLGAAFSEAVTQIITVLSDQQQKIADLQGEVTALKGPHV